MLLEMQTRYFHLTDFKRRENGFQVYPHLKCQWLTNSSRARPLIAFLKTSNDSMFAKLSGRSFQS